MSIGKSDIKLYIYAQGLIDETIKGIFMKVIDKTQYRNVAGAGLGDTCGPSGNNCGGSSGSAGSNGGNSGKQIRDYQTSNRGSGSQANHFGQGGGSFGSSGGCTGGRREPVGSSR